MRLALSSAVAALLFANLVQAETPLEHQPTVEAVLGASAFASRWEKTGEEVRGEMKTTAFRNREDPAFSLLVSRAKGAGQRLDRVQVIATATYKMSK